MVPFQSATNFVMVRHSTWSERMFLNMLYVKWEMLLKICSRGKGSRWMTSAFSFRTRPISGFSRAWPNGSTCPLKRSIPPFKSMVTHLQPVFPQPLMRPTVKDGCKKETSCYSAYLAEVLRGEWCSGAGSPFDDSAEIYLF